MKDEITTMIKVLNELVEELEEESTNETLIYLKGLQDGRASGYKVVIGMLERLLKVSE